MGCDLFNNDKNNYVSAGLSPCAGSGEDKNAEFIDRGFGIVSGSEILAKLDLDHISIPVNSWVQRTQVLQPGEVTYIQGLAKGLINKAHGFTMPSLSSIDEVLDPFFLEVDISVNYYAGFTFTFKNIDASGNIDTNIPVDTATSSAFDTAGVNASMSYDPSILTFISTQVGYEYNITNVILTVIDASQDSRSPFPTIIISGERYPQVYTLEEDPSAAIPSSKYPTTASQGIFMTAKPPSDDSISCYDKWIYINHATDFVTTFTEVNLAFDSSVNTSLIIAYDGSTLLGIKPVIIDDVSIADSSANYDVSVGEIVILDGSISISNIIMDGSTLVNYNITDSSILNSSVTYSSIYGGYIATSDILEDGSISYFSGSTIQESSIGDAHIISSTITDAPYINDSILSDSTIIDSSLNNDNQLLRTDVSGGTVIDSVDGLGSSSAYSNFNNVVTTTDPSISLQYYNIGGMDLASAASAYFAAQDSSLSDIMGLTTFSTKELNMADSTASLISNSVIVSYNSSIFDSSLLGIKLDQSNVYRSVIDDLAASYANDSKFWDSSISGGTLKIQDSSIFTSEVNAVIDNSQTTDTSIYNSNITNTEMIQSRIQDSSIAVNSIFNNDTSVANSNIINSWSNVYVLVTNPSTGDAIYVMEDDSLDIDSSAWRVNISSSLIWDSSFNNTTIRDSSIYNSYFQDSSIIGCTTYNCIFEDSADIDTRTIMIDASISCDVSIFQDTSIYYDRQVRQLDIGMNGTSDSTFISAGDYLTHVTENGLWKKVADIYAWTSAKDPSIYETKNLINGFYAFNPHEFQYQIDYIIFV